METIATRKFNFGIGLSGALALIIAAFFKTYFAAIPQNFMSISWAVHLHAALGIAWMALLLRQYYLIGHDRPMAHRRLGKLGYLLMPLLLLSLLPMLFFIWLRGDKLLMFATLSDAALLVIFFLGGMIWRKNRAIHQRLLLATGLVLLDPILARFVVNLLGLPGPWANHLPFLVMDLAVIAFIFKDIRRGQNYKPWAVVMGCFLAYQTAAYVLAFQYQPVKTNPKTMDLVKIENIEISAWLDLFAAMPDGFKQERGCSSAIVDGVSVFTCKKIPFPHFNVPLNLGVVQPLTENALDKVLAHFRSEDVGKFYVHFTPLTQPQQARDWFQRRGLRHQSSWHRLARENGPLELPLKTSNNYQVEEVTKESAPAWAKFIDDIYGMPTSPWLLELPGRPGWHHVICRDASGKIIAARSMRINPDGTAYFMIDAPVPGIMTQDFEPDYLLDRRLVEIGLQNDVKVFTADIEKPSPLQDTPAYHYWTALGFSVVYEKQNFLY